MWGGNCSFESHSWVATVIQPSALQLHRNRPTPPFYWAPVYCMHLRAFIQPLPPPNGGLYTKTTKTCYTIFSNLCAGNLVSYCCLLRVLSKDMQSGFWGVSNIQCPITFQHHNTSWIWFMHITAKGFGKPHIKFGILLSMHVWVRTVSNMGCWFFLITLMLVHVSSKKMCLWRHSAYHLKAHRIWH